MLVNLNGILLDKNEAKLPVIVPGVMYGQGIFETILIKKGKPCFLKKHLERLKNSLQTAELNINKNVESVESDFIRTIEANGIIEGVGKITVCKGESGTCHIIITVKDGIPYSKSQYKTGFKLVKVDYKNNPYSPLTYIKSCNFLDNILARKQANKKGGDEGLILNVDNYVAEGTVSNIFLVNEEGAIYTPDLRIGLLPGIVRQVLLNETKNIGITIYQDFITYSELIKAKEVFITNSLLGIMPVKKIDGYMFNTSIPGPVTSKLMSYYQQQLENSINKY